MPAYPSGFASITEITPALVPFASAADVVAQNAWIEQIILTNATDDDITITVQDKQSTPAPILSAYTIPSRETVPCLWPGGAFMSGGINWQASATGLWARVRYKV